MAIDTFDDIQFITRPLLNSNASLSLKESLGRNMTILTFDFLDLPPVMAFRAILHKCFAVVLTRSMTVGTLQPFACTVSFMGKFDVVKRNGPSFYPNVAQGRTGHLGLKFLGFITLINGCKSLLSLIIGCVEKFEGILDIVNTLPEKDKAIIVSGFTKEVLCLFKICRASSDLLNLI
jgi:hypothetical protein